MVKLVKEKLYEDSVKDIFLTSEITEKKTEFKNQNPKIKASDAACKCKSSFYVKNDDGSTSCNFCGHNWKERKKEIKKIAPTIKSEKDVYSELLKDLK